MRYRRRTNRLWQTGFFGLCCALVAVLPRTAAADTFKVAMLVSSASEEGEAAAAAIRSHLSDLPVELVIEKTEGISFDVVKLHAVVQEIASRVQSRVVFFADFRDPDRTVLFVSIPKVGTTLIRHIDCEDETLSSRYEATAVIIRGILISMLGGGEIGIHVPPAPPQDAVKAQPEVGAQKATKPVPPKAGEAKKDSEIQAAKEKAALVSTRTSRFHIDTSYTLGLRFSDRELMTHALRIGLLGFVGKRAFLFAAYRFTLPFSNRFSSEIKYREATETVNLLLTVSLHPIEIGAGTRWQWKTVDLHLGAALMVDVIYWRSTTVKSDSQDENTGTGITFDTSRSPHAALGWRMGISPHAALGWRITDATTLYIAFLADFLIYKKNFETTIEDTQNNTYRGTLSELNFVNLGAQIGLRFML
jgi:hypothetical protein